MVAPKRQPDRSQPSPVRSGDTAHFARRVFVASGVVALVVIGLALLWYTLWVWLLAFAGVLLALFLRGLTIGLSRSTGLPNGWSLSIVIVVLAGVTTGALWVLSPRIVEQTRELRETLPEAVAELAEQAQRYEWGAALSRGLEQVEMADLQEMLATGAAAMLTNVFSAIIGIVVVLFLGLYLAINPRMYIDGALRLLAPPARPHARDVIYQTGTMLMWWLLGRLLAMAFVAVAVSVSLWALGVPLSFTLGLIAGLLDFIPNVGPILAALPAVLIAFAESPQTALYVIIVYFVIQQVESYIVTPIVQQHVVKLPPALTVFVQVLFFVMGGLLGLLLATPITVAVVAVVRELYVKDTLGDELDEETEEPRERRPTVERLRAERVRAKK